ncbi:hypothetical protein TNCV_957641 [Trichonephila clavipes]|nr:hypothetical protein TNCV_957641 [Trichonephila clavipes]
MLRRLVGTTAPGHHDCVQFRNEKVSNHGSIPITIDCNVVAFIVFEEGFHQPIKRTKQSALHRKAKFAYENREQWQSRFGPIRRIYALLDDRFDDLPNHKLRINHLTAVKSVAILESNANLNFYTWKKSTLY